MYDVFEAISTAKFVYWNFGLDGYGGRKKESSCFAIWWAR